MNQSTKKVIGLFAALTLISAFAIYIGISMYGIYAKQSSSTSARIVSRAFALPAANVGKRVVTYNRFLSTRDAVLRFINSDAGGEVGATKPSDSELNKNILEQLIRQKMLEEIAEAREVKIEETEVDEIFQQVVAQAASSTTPDITQYLKDNYGWNESDFREYVLRPALLEQKLTMLLAEETDPNNPDPYALENKLMERRQSGDVVVYLKFAE